jgi:type III pantothenate kinase
MPVNLVIDIGNTRTKLALFNDFDLMFNVPIDELKPEQVIMLQEEHPLLNRAILSSVKEYNPQLRELLASSFETFIELDHTTPIPITNCYSTPETLGKDRLAAAVGANELFPNQNLLVIDAGTAITFDFVSAQNEYLGGNISPGKEMRLKALHHFTGKLPLVKASDEFKLIGTTTESAILAGVMHGIIFEIDQYIDFFKENFENLKVVMTGGDSNLFDKKLKNSIFVHFNLTLIGLNRILEYNVSKK